MIVVKVTYTVKQEFVAANQENIHRFVDDFKNTLDNTAFRYTIYTTGDGRTFIHHSVYRDEAIQKALLNVPSFLLFQQQRDASGLEGQPEIQVLTLVDTSHQLSTNSQALW